MMTIDPSSNRTDRATILWIGAIVAPFYLNDFAYIGLRSYFHLLGVDYGFRVLVLVLIFAVPSARRLALTTEERRTEWVETAIQIFAISALLVVAISIAMVQIGDVWPSSRLATWPRPDSRTLHIVDLTLGLALVAISEELVFRKLLWNGLSSFGWHATWIVAVSSAAFGFAHWSRGVEGILSATVAGMLLFLLYRSTGRLGPSIAAHYLSNLYFFTR